MRTAAQGETPARSGTRLYPDFLIVGVMKAATTALSRCLGRHPNVYLPERELHFFSREDRYRLGARYYQEQFDPGPAACRIGEKTPTYSCHPEAPRRIARFNAEMKLIWIFRNPTERAYSHYRYFVQNGQERHSFEKALALEPTRARENIGYAYVGRGLYAAQIRHFLHYFPRRQMLFLLHETFRDDPEAAVQACLEFLELPAAPDLTAGIRPQNVTHLPRSTTLQWLAYTLFYGRVPAAYRLILRLNRRQGGYPPLPPAVRATLDRFYAPYNAEFADLTGLDITGWG